MNNLNDVPTGTKILIDANIILYTALNHPNYQKDCTDFLIRIEKKEIMGYIPSVVIEELFHHFMMSELIEKGFGKRVSDCISYYKQNPMIIEELRKTWDEINRVFRINCIILYDNEIILKQSLQIAQRFQLLAHDAYIVAFAQSNNISHIASNDNDFLRVRDMTIWKPQRQLCDSDSLKH